MLWDVFHVNFYGRFCFGIENHVLPWYFFFYLIYKKKITYINRKFKHRDYRQNPYKLTIKAKN